MLSNEALTYMLDTNVFNDVLWGKFPLSIFKQRQLIVTGIQRDELNKTENDETRAALLGRFTTVDSVVVPAASLAFGIEGAGWGQAHWDDGSGNIERMRRRLQQLDGRKKRRKDPLNQERDILIAETTIKAGAVLISADVNLRSVVVEFGGQTLNPATLQGYSVST